jgi:hypothetical protein
MDICSTASKCTTGVEFCSVLKANQVGRLPLTSRKASVPGQGRRLGMQLLPWAEASLIRSALYPLLRLFCYLHPALPPSVCFRPFQLSQGILQPPCALVPLHVSRIFLFCLHRG